MAEPPFLRPRGESVAGDDDLKRAVARHWQDDVCESWMGKSRNRREYFEEILRERYRLQPYIPGFAGFDGAQGRAVLEIGVGSGSDFSQWVSHGARATGIDLTAAAIETTRERLQCLGIEESRYALRRADCETLPFADSTFDIVYSFGVLHHTPRTETALREAFRVLKPGGDLRVMVYGTGSWTGLMLWVRYGLLAGRWRMTQKEAMFRNLESPGTKAYTNAEFRALLETAGFAGVETERRLNHGDLLLIRRSKAYQSPVYALIWKLYPRWLVRLLGDRYGLYILATARKP